MSIGIQYNKMSEWVSKKEKKKIIIIIYLFTIVTMVAALSVLVLIVVSDAVLEPLTTTFGTVRQLRLPPADLKCNRRNADAACARKSLSLMILLSVA